MDAILANVIMSCWARMLAIGALGCAVEGALLGWQVGGSGSLVVAESRRPSVVHQSSQSVGSWMVAGARREAGRFSRWALTEWAAGARSKSKRTP